MTRPRLCASLLPEWLGDRCEQHPSHFDAAGALYDDWRAYAHARGQEPGSPPEFAAEMERRGFECDRLEGERNRIRWGLRRLPAIPKE
jgi:phage/plasmid-associated DNA primase